MILVTQQNTNLGGPTFDNNYFNDKYITLEEPRVKLFSGKFDSHNSNGFSGSTYVMPDYYGTFNACFQGQGTGCAGNKTMNIEASKMKGLWVPPNKYVYLYPKYTGDIQSIVDSQLSKDYNNKPIEYQIEWEEGEESKYKTFCPNANQGEVPVNFTNVKFQCINDERFNDITNNKYVKNKLGYGAAAWVWPYNNLREFFDDPCYGMKKKIIMKYNCGSNGNILPPSDKLGGNYLPGYYTSLDASSDPLLNNLLSSNNYIPNKKYPNHDDEKTIVIRPLFDNNGEIKPWKDHLVDCCSGKINNRTLCGSFMPTNTDGSNKCSFLVDEKIKSDNKLVRKYATIDDIKDISEDGKTPAGKFSWLCKKNPAVCDNIKKEFCANPENANSPWCDCINAPTRQEYISLKNRLNQANLSTYINKCMMASCRTDENDLSKNFILSSELGKDCPTPEAIQQTIVSGSQNVLTNVAQGISITKTPIPSNQQTGQQTNQTGQQTNQTTQTTQTTQTNQTKTLLYFIFGFILLLIAIVVISVFIMNRKKKLNEKKIIK